MTENVKRLQSSESKNEKNCQQRKGGEKSSLELRWVSGLKNLQFARIKRATIDKIGVNVIVHFTSDCKEFFL